MVISSWLAEQKDRGSIPGLGTWIFRDWLSPASKSRYGWKIAKSTLILKTTNQANENNHWYQTFPTAVEPVKEMAVTRGLVHRTLPTAGALSRELVMITYLSYSSGAGEGNGCHQGTRTQDLADCRSVVSRARHNIQDSPRNSCLLCQLEKQIFKKVKYSSF